MNEHPVRFDRRGPSLRDERRTIATLMLCFWMLWQILFFVDSTLVGAKGQVDPGDFLLDLAGFLTFLPEVTLALIGCLICSIIYLLLVRVRHVQLWKQVLAALVVSLVSAVAFCIAQILTQKFFGEPGPALTPMILLLGAVRGLAPFGLWSGIALVVTYNGELRERERRLAMLEAQAQDAQLRALRYQVNPHLLYNALNSIAALILARKNDVAEAMLLRLASFFRASLSSDPHSDIPLADEIALQMRYLEIEQMRFPNLSVDFSLPEGLGQVRVPSLILQPLIENVLKHGANPDGNPTQLKIAAMRNGGRLVLEVSDNGPGISSYRGTGVGLGNVRSRLATRFGGRASLETDSRPGLGFTVRLTIPVIAR